MSEGEAGDEGGARPLADPRVENVLGAAMLCATAFRLRDGEALILMLRRLSDAVAMLGSAESVGEAGAAAARPVSMRDTALVEKSS